MRASGLKRFSSKSPGLVVRLRSSRQRTPLIKADRRQLITSELYRLPSDRQRSLLRFPLVRSADETSIYLFRPPLFRIFSSACFSRCFRSAGNSAGPRHFIFHSTLYTRRARYRYSGVQYAARYFLARRRSRRHYFSLYLSMQIISVGFHFIYRK